MPQQTTPPQTAAKDNAGTVVVSETGLGPYQLEAKAGDSKIRIDEPVSAGGQGTGPSPFELLGAALGACTTLTVRLYATRKGWPLEKVSTVVSHQRASLKARDAFEARVTLEGPLDDEQRKRLMQVAERCPVHLTLDRGADVHTTLESTQVVLEKPVPDVAHMDCMKESCAEQPAA
jgi:putative redox protein